MRENGFIGRDVKWSFCRILIKIHVRGNPGLEKKKCGGERENSKMCRTRCRTEQAVNSTRLSIAPSWERI